MIKRLTDFYKKHRYAFIWTVCYIAVMWVVLHSLFHFDMFSWRHWGILMRAHLRGFPGFVFGILMLAAGPMYVATTMLIVRTGKPLFTIPLPQVPEPVRRLIPTRASKEADKSAESSDTPEPAAEPVHELPGNLPGELRGAFLRAREKPAFEFATVPASAPVSADTPVATDDQLVPDGLPLPTDFGFDDAPVAAPAMGDFPTFTTLNFDDAPATSASPEPADTNTAPAIPDIAAPDPEIVPVVDYIKSTGRDYQITDGIILCGGMAIAAHTNNEFWIADDDDWFASGQQKPSPVTVVRRVADAHGVAPVMYLGTKNIMDIDGRIAEWTANGVRVVSDLNELFG